MLSAIRDRSKSFVVYGLFVLLILSFVVWGAGDVVTGNMSRNVVATVGDQQIEEPELRDAFNREVNRLRSVFGDRFGQREAAAMGFELSVLATLIDETLYNLGAADLGLLVSDELVRQEINKDPAFRNTIGDFDLLRYQQILAANGFTEARYINLIRNDIRRGLYLDALQSGARAPEAMVDALFRFINEERSVTVVEISDEQAADRIGEPSEDELSAFYAANTDQFIAPEYRAVSYVYLTAGDLAGDINVSEAELEQAYAEQEAQFNVPEKRTIRQIVVSDEATSKDIYAALSSGTAFLSAAEDMAGMSPEATTLGAVTKDQYLPELADAVFALQQGDFTQPIKSPLGWHIVQVTEIEEGTTKSIEEVRDQLVRSVQLSKAVDSLFELSNTFEDALGGGATLEEAAATIGVNVKMIDAIDARGQNPLGTAVAGLPLEGGFTNVLFETPESQESALIESGTDGYFLLRVDGIIPSRVKPLDEVRAAAIGSWRVEQKAKASETEAQAILDGLQGGRMLEAYATDQNLTVATVENFKRSGSAELPSDLVEKIFDTNLNGSAIGRDDNRSLVVQVIRITPANPAANPEAMAELRDQVNQTVNRDVLVSLAESLKVDHPVQINQSALDGAF